MQSRRLVSTGPEASRPIIFSSFWLFHRINEGIGPAGAFLTREAQGETRRGGDRGIFTESLGAKRFYATK